MEKPARLDKAQGYVELGMLNEAREELARLTQEQRESNAARELQIVLFLDEALYEEAFKECERLVRQDPENHVGFVQGAFSLHAIGKTKAAIDFLQGGPESLQDEPVYFYNLACYELALGKNQAALTWLERSFAMDKRFVERALRDPDLTALRDQIREFPN